MRRLVQVVAYLNGVFAFVVGVLATLSPATAAAAFKVTIASAAMLALIRMFGGLYATSGLISGFIARDVDRSLALNRLYAFALLILNVGGDCVIVASGELQLGQIAVGMLIELVLGALLLAYRSGAR